MARKRKGRPLNGILLLDKPTGASSNNILQQVRRLYNAQKAGHTGSLDPLASGMLPICFGEATKFSQFLLDADKAYRVTAQLGVITTTEDAEGEIVETRPVDVSEEQLNNVVQSFLGESMQVPSMYSALKHNGQPLYKLARQGIEVEREARPISIHHIKLESFDGEFFSLYVSCSKGTYIRNLVADIGLKLGCGAHVTALRREWVGHFKNDSMITLDQLQVLRDEDAFEELDNLLLPIEASLEGYSQVVIDLQSAHYFCNGNPVSIKVDAGEGELIKVFDEEGLFLGVATINDDLQLAPKRLVVYEHN